MLTEFLIAEAIAGLATNNTRERACRSKPPSAVPTAPAPNITYLVPIGSITYDITKAVAKPNARASARI
jgi:hypothetical protein